MTGAGRLRGWSLRGCRGWRRMRRAGCGRCRGRRRMGRGGRRRSRLWLRRRCHFLFAPLRRRDGSRRRLTGVRGLRLRGLRLRGGRRRRRMRRGGRRRSRLLLLGRRHLLLPLALQFAFPLLGLHSGCCRGVRRGRCRRCRRWRRMGSSRRRWRRRSLRMLRWRKRRRSRVRGLRRRRRGRMRLLWRRRGLMLRRWRWWRSLMLLLRRLLGSRPSRRSFLRRLPLFRSPLRTLLVLPGLRHNHRRRLCARWGCRQRRGQRGGGKQSYLQICHVLGSRGILTKSRGGGVGEKSRMRQLNKRQRSTSVRPDCGGVRPGTRNYFRHPHHLDA